MQRWSERPGWGRKAVGCLVLVMLAGCSGGSRESDSIRGPGRAASPPAQAPREGLPAAVADSAAPTPDQPLEGFRDEGDPCREHLYRVAPGETVILSFEKRLSRVAEEGEVALTPARNDWERWGVDLQVNRAAVSRHSVSRSRWVVDLGDQTFARDDRDEPRMYVRNDTPGARGVTGLKWVEGTLYTVWEIDGRRWSVGALRNLSLEALEEICGGEPEFSHMDSVSGRQLVFPLQTQQFAEDVSVLTAEVEVILPAEITAVIQGGEMWLESPAIGRLTLRLSYNPGVSRGVTISGPAYRPECE